MLALLLATLMAQTGTEMPIALNVTILRADSDAWPADHAAAELARYVEEMTGARVRVAGPGEPVPDDAPTITLALEEEAARLRELPGAEDLRRLRAGFLIRSQGLDRLLIAALDPVGLLYGVYEYLETHCGCGFFWDGDYVPQRSDLPLEGIDVEMLPRWPVRHFGLATGWGLSKWHDQFRTPAHRRQILDWMAKRRINRSGHYFGKHIAHSGLPSKEVFGLSDEEPDNFTFAGWPGALDWPAAVRTAFIRAKMEEGRQRGIEWITHIPYSEMPHQFRQLHPEYRYVEHLGYSATHLYPSDPECARWARAFFRAVIDTYGTDHLYMDTPFVESTGAATPEESFELKLDAARQLLARLQELDPDAVWQWDSWDFGAQPGVWTPERIRRYIESLPRDRMIVYDTAGIGNPFYKRTDYFHGAPWAFGFLHAFQGDDHLHGDLQQAIDVLQELSRDPRADRCQGIYHVPEISGHNVLYFDLTTHLAWHPDGLTLEGYLDGYTRRRYGSGDFETMRPAVEVLVRAVHRGGGQIPIYQKLGCPYGPVEWWPIVDDKQAPHPAQNGSGIRDLEQTLRFALSCRRRQQDNPLYVNDIVDWCREYLAHVFNRATLQAYQAFKEGGLERMNASIALARACLHHIEMILSTRPDFSLQRQIEWVMQVPGANPYTPWYIKQHCINDLYCVNDVYEQLRGFYRPRMEVYFSELERRAAEGTSTVVWGDLAGRCEPIRDRWLNQEIAVPEEEKYRGTTMEAVVDALQAIPSMIPEG